MARYRKKPVEIEAWQSGSGLPKPPWLIKAMKDCIATEYIDGTWLIRTLEGDHYGQSGDYIIRGVKGELYPCKPDVFELTYEPMER